MDIRAPDQQYNPYRIFTREQWAHLRDDMPMTLEASEIARLRSMHDRLDLREVEEIYLPLSRMLSIYVDAMQRLYVAQRRFLGIQDRKMPYIIGVAGSVAVGKSTTARVLQALLARWSPRPKVDLVTTDGFLFPNAALERQGLMQKKGFPESYDLPRLLSFLSDIKAGRERVRAPVYSHLTYDIIPNEWNEVDRPDILIVEGVNVLQTGRLPRDGKAVPVVSDFFDFSVYIDAEEPVLRDWYIRRFLALRDTAFHDPRSYFHRYALLSDEEADRHRDRDLGAHQPRQPRRQHFADTPARDADPQEGRRPRRRNRGAAAALIFEKARLFKKKKFNRTSSDVFISQGRWNHPPLSSAAIEKVPRFRSQGLARRRSQQVWRFKSPYHRCGVLFMRTFEPKPHSINKLC